LLHSFEAKIADTSGGLSRSSLNTARILATLSGKAASALWFVKYGTVRNVTEGERWR
jgi:hypothetical protein